jgi:hypothetical protein
MSRTFLLVVMLAAACGSSRERAIPIEVQVESGHSIVAGKDLSRPLDDQLLDAVRKRPEVLAARPRAELLGAASGAMKVDGQDVHFEVGGFVDGIAPEALADEPELRALFEAPGAVPILVSPTLVDLYNTTVAPSRGLPLLDPGMLELLAKHGSLHVTISLGTSTVAGPDAPPATATVDAVVIGMSPHARSIGFTVPLAAIQDWNRQLGVTGAHYRALDVTLRGVSSIEPFSRWVKDQGYRVSDSFRMTPRP